LVAFQKRARQLAKLYGDHFKPIKLINQMAKNGETFYGRFGQEASKKAA
jgi:3-hydroxyacyl-CoA dehydrogenase/enoyl-CoA hydratase/3-hydroxybutyryl-CoA epimerase